MTRSLQAPHCQPLASLVLEQCSRIAQAPEGTPLLLKGLKVPLLNVIWSCASRSRCIRLPEKKASAQQAFQEAIFMNGAAMAGLTSLMSSLLHDEGIHCLPNAASQRLFASTLIYTLFEVVVRTKLDRLRTLEEDAEEDIQRVDRSSAPQVIGYTTGQPSRFFPLPGLRQESSQLRLRTSRRR